MTDASVVFEANLAEKSAFFAVSDRLLLCLEHISENQNKIFFLKTYFIGSNPLLIKLVHLLNSDWLLPSAVLLGSFYD